jgi:uncharacterized membrane protein
MQQKPSIMTKLFNLMSMSKESNAVFLREEYFHLQKAVESFDERVLLVKSWSVTASLATFGLALKEKQSGLFLVASCSALLFWIIEAVWKSFQQAYYPRIRAIEEYMCSGESTELSSPSILRSWASNWRWHNFIRIMPWGHVCLPHAPIFIAGFILWGSLRIA